MKKIIVFIIFLGLLTGLAFGEGKLSQREWQIVTEINNGLDALPPQQGLIPTAEERAGEERVMRSIANKYGMTVGEVKDISARGYKQYLDR